MKEFRERLALAWKIVRGKDDNLVKFAKSELNKQLALDEDDPDYWMATGIVDIARVFSTQGHSGFSAAYAIKMMSRLLSFKPISPLTGVESEWGEPFSEDGTRQNNRCSTVFQSKDGKAYDIEYYYFAESDGNTYTSYESRKTIEFPYTKKDSVRINFPIDASHQERLDAINTFEGAV